MRTSPAVLITAAALVLSVHHSVMASTRETFHYVGGSGGTPDPEIALALSTATGQDWYDGGVELHPAGARTMALVLHDAVLEDGRTVGVFLIEGKGRHWTYQPACVTLGRPTWFTLATDAEYTDLYINGPAYPDLDCRTVSYAGAGAAFAVAGDGTVTYRR